MKDIKQVIGSNPFALASRSPMQLISIDSIGPLAESSTGKKHVMVVIDNFTRFVELYAVETLEAIEAARCLLDYFGRYGVPEDIITDKGTQFCNELFAALSVHLGNKHHFTVTGSKEENGLVERANKEVMRHLRGLIFESGAQFYWHEKLPFVQRIMNATRHSSTGVAPATLLFGNSIDLHRSLFIDEAKKTVANKKPSSKTLAEQPMRYWLDQMLKVQRELIQAAQRTQERLDTIHLEERQPSEVAEFPPGSYVTAHYNGAFSSHRPPSKFLTKRYGPMKVISQEGNHVTVTDLTTDKSDVYHVQQLQPFLTGGRSEDELRIIAARDKGLLEVEEVIFHSGYDEENPNRKTLLKFHVKWKGLSHIDDSWQPYSNLRSTEALHDYLKSRNLEHLIPTEFRQKGRKKRKTAQVEE
eukprot:gene13059-14326_t